MATIITDLKESFRRGNIYIQLIYINVGGFVLTTLTEVILQLFNRSLGGMFEWLELPASLSRFIVQPWSILTYMFMHAGVLHILFNMLWLYWFGALFLNFFSAKHLRGVYILGGICGGILYMAAYNIFPYFQPMTEYSFMLGHRHLFLRSLLQQPTGNPTTRYAFSFRNDTLEISGIDCCRNGFIVHHLQQCRRTYSPFRRSIGGTMVCSQP